MKTNQSHTSEMLEALKEAVNFYEEIAAFLEDHSLAHIAETNSKRLRELIVKVKGERCTHVWKWHDGCLGYESQVCTKCGVDINDLPAEGHEVSK